MKKIALFGCMILLITGCDNANTMTLTCTDNTDSNGLKSEITYDIEYQNDDIKFVKITYDYSKNSQTDGVGTGTDGTTEDTNSDNNGIIDGQVEEKADDLIDGTTDTILDISGIRESHENRLNTYQDYDGFTSHVDTNNDERYKIVYEIDVTKMDENNLSSFNISSKSLETTRNTFEDQGLTCKQLDLFLNETNFML